MTLLNRPGVLGLIKKAKYFGSIYNTKGSAKPVGDPESTVKLLELFRARYTEQLTKKIFHKYLIVKYYRSYLKILARFGVTVSWKRVFHD